MNGNECTYTHVCENVWVWGLNFNAHKKKREERIRKLEEEVKKLKKQLERKD